MKKTITSRLFQVFGVIAFFAINIGIKILEVNIAIWYDFEVAIILMFLTSLILRYLIILIYDYLKIDWLLIESLKSKLEKNEDISESTSITRKIIRLKKIGNWFLLIGLIIADPTVTALYYRDGHSTWNNIPLKTFKLFLTSVIVCTITLIGSIYLLINPLKWLVNLIF